MGLLFSVLQSIFDCLRGSRKNDYKQINSPKNTINNNNNNNNNNKLERSCSAEKPKIHKACRSTIQSLLTPYQNKIDNLKPSEIVYVSLRNNSLKILA